MPGRLTNPIDAYVGSRLRLLRTKQNVTQQGIAELLGISFQQLQKYEKGINRIGAGRLQHLSQIFDVPVDFFFDGAPRLAGSVRKDKQAPSMDYVDDFLAGAEGRRWPGRSCKSKIPQSAGQSFTWLKLWPSLAISKRRFSLSQ
jgi:transcriptional regulator with XRE-family HTH domain